MITIVAIVVATPYIVLTRLTPRSPSSVYRSLTSIRGASHFLSAILPFFLVEIQLEPNAILAYVEFQFHESPMLSFHGIDSMKDLQHKPS
mgnify:CR=1 FL=1